MLKVQKILINLAKILIKYSDEVNERETEKYYECLTLVCKREEFNLSHLGFDSYGEILKKKGKLSKASIKKLKIGLSFQGFLYQVLKIVVNKLKQRGSSEAERNFIEYFCAMAYFYIPEVRQKLLESFKESLIFNEQNDISPVFKFDTKESEIKNKDFMSLFDWEKDFYRYLKVY